MRLGRSIAQHYRKRSEVYGDIRNPQKYMLSSAVLDGLGNCKFLYEDKKYNISSISTILYQYAQHLKSVAAEKRSILRHGIFGLMKKTQFAYGGSYAKTLHHQTVLDQIKFLKAGDRNSINNSVVATAIAFDKKQQDDDSYVWTADDENHEYQGNFSA